MKFDPDCKRCKRLADFLADVKEEHPDYFCKPVPVFGDKNARLLIVGLAPGLHGANASGRPFTGDFAGILLYQTLHKFGLATAAESISRDDGLKLINCRITNAVKCLPPQNKPLTSEIKECNQFLKTELENLPENAVVIALGGIAHNAVLRAKGVPLSSCKFGHNQLHDLGAYQLLDSYHCSRYNTQTKRLTEEMFHDVFIRAIKRMKK
jgi:uracil-DNA glycosylase family 4